MNIIPKRSSVIKMTSKQKAYIIIICISWTIKFMSKARLTVNLSHKPIN